MTDRPGYACPRCQIGQCHAVELTYTRMYHGVLFSAPAVPAWGCDICGLQEYDQEIIMQFERIMGQGTLPTLHTGKKPAMTKPSKEGKSPRFKA
jgi:hypothetical protein